VAGEHAGQIVMGYQGVEQAETGGPAAASTVLQPLPAFADDIVYIHDIRLHVYINIYIHIYICHTFTCIHIRIHTCIYIYI